MDKLELQSISSIQSKQVAIPNYVEFVINGKPLSDIINDTFKPKDRVLSKYTSVLGTMEYTNFDKLKIKQLTGEKITPEVLETIFPAAHFDHKPILEELGMNRILIYCCAECADFKCGGFFTKITFNSDEVIWEIMPSKNPITFKFLKSEYLQTLQEYLDNLEV